MKLQLPRTSLRMLFLLLAICASICWLYAQVLPEVRRYRRLQASIRSTSDRSFVTMEDVIVNLSSKNATRYLRLGIVLEVPRKDELLVATRAEAERASLRDWLFTHLAAKTVHDVRGPEGINRLRDEVEEHVRGALFADGDAGLRRVVFDEFMVQ